MEGYPGQKSTLPHAMCHPPSVSHMPSFWPWFPSISNCPALLEESPICSLVSATRLSPSGRSLPCLRKASDLIWPTTDAVSKLYPRTVLVAYVLCSIGSRALQMLICWWCHRLVMLVTCTVHVSKLSRFYKYTSIKFCIVDLRTCIFGDTLPYQLQLC